MSIWVHLNSSPSLSYQKGFVFIKWKFNCLFLTLLLLSWSHQSLLPSLYLFEALINRPILYNSFLSFLVELWAKLRQPWKPISSISWSFWLFSLSFKLPSCLSWVWHVASHQSKVSILLSICQYVYLSSWLSVSQWFYLFVSCTHTSIVFKSHHIHYYYRLVWKHFTSHKIHQSSNYFPIHSF